MKERYYEAIDVGGGFKGRIYRYKEDGNHTEVVWLSPLIYNTSEEALDSAIEWAEAHGMEVELG